MHRFRHLAIAILLGALITSFAADQSPTRSIGVARVDITPTYPIRLSGYAVRKTEATRTPVVMDRRWAAGELSGPGRQRKTPRFWVGSVVWDSRITRRARRRPSLVRRRRSCRSDTRRA